MHYADVPPAQVLVAFCGRLRQQDVLPSFLTASASRHFWRRWGWLVLWRARLLEAGQAAPPPPITASTGDGRDCHMVLDLVRRLVMLENEDLFRSVARHLV